MTDKVFDLCVDILIYTGRLTHLSYKTVNVWIFCIIWPALTLALIYIVIRQRIRIKKLIAEKKE